MGRKRLLRGKKFNGNHTTMTPHGKIIVKAAKKIDHVRKITIGPIKKARNGRPRLKCEVQRSGLKATVRGTTAVQTFNIITDRPEEAKDIIIEAWPYDVT